MASFRFYINTHLFVVVIDPYNLCACNIDRFYYPHGKPTLTVASDRTLQRILTALDAFPNRQPDRESFGEVVEACGYPRYWRMPLFSCAQLTTGGPADGKRFIDFWKE